MADERADVKKEVAAPEAIPGQISDDPYAEKLPGILWEYQQAHEEVVSAKHWVLPAIFAMLPAIGTIYAFFRRRAKNRNIRNYFRAASWVSLVMTIAFAGIVAIGYYEYFSWQETREETAVAEPVSEPEEEEPEQEETEEAEEPEQTPEEQTEEEQPGSEAKEAEDALTNDEVGEEIAPVSYKAESGAFDFEMDRKTYRFPLTVGTVEPNGWALLGADTDEADPSRLIASLHDAGGSTLYLIYAADADIGSVSCMEMEVVLTSGETTFMGLTSSSSPEIAGAVFSAAEAANADGFDGLNGQIVYAYGAYDIYVNFTDGHAASAGIRNR